MIKGDKYVQIYFWLVVISMLLWVVTLFCEGSGSSQFQIFFLKCNNLFADFTNLCGYSANRDVYNNDINGYAQKPYPPLSYVFTSIFARLDVGVTPAYTELYKQPEFLIIYVLFVLFIFYAISVIVNCELKGNALNRYLLSIPIMFSGVMIFALERANMILLSYMFSMMFLFWYDSEKRMTREVSLLALGIAVSLKLTPMVFVLMLIYEKRFRDVGKVIIYSAFLTIVPFYYFNGGLSNIPLMIRNMHELADAFASVPNVTLDSYVTLLIDKHFVHGIRGYFAWSIIWRLIGLGSTCIIIVTAWCLERKWEKCLVISMILLLVPSFNSEYCMLYYIPALVMFLGEEKREKLDAWCLIGFILICWVYVLPFKDMEFLVQCRLALLCFYIFTMIKSIRIFRNVILMKNWRSNL